MRSERARIDRRLTVTPTTELLPAIGAVVTFRDEWGAIVQVFDLTKLGFSGELTMLFADAFRMHYAGSAAPTRKGCWKALHAVARFVVEDGGITVPADLGTEAIGRYIAWLDRQRSPNGIPWSTSTRHGRFIYVKMMLVWAIRNRPDRFSTQIKFPHNPFAGRHSTPVPRRLAAVQLKVILRACYEETDAAWTRFEQGQAMLARPLAAAASDPSDLAALLHVLHRRGNGILPRYLATNATDISQRLYNRHGGALILEQYLHLTVDTLVPFYLAIAIQTAANPDALRLVERDCLVPHPLDEHRCVIEWAKPRAGGTVRRAQRRSFDRRRQHAAPNLIDKVMMMTAPLVPHALPSEGTHLFLIRGYGRAGVRAIAEQTLSTGIRRFIVRANKRIVEWNFTHPEQPRSLLPNFSPVLFRGSVATQHYHEAGGDIRVAQAVLNHVRADTTDLYVRGPETQRLQDETVARLQKLMVAWITGGQSPRNDLSDTRSGAAFIALAENANAFGHICTNPLVGAAPGSTPGRMCPQFAACLTCPGLVIPVDAEHLARILQARCQLESARARIDPHRWQLLYAASHRVLTEDILPDFPIDLRPAAERLMLSLPLLPDLE
jgi:hypothetical protein